MTNKPLLILILLCAQFHATAQTPAPSPTPVTPEPLTVKISGVADWLKVNYSRSYTARVTGINGTDQTANYNLEWGLVGEQPKGVKAVSLSIVSTNKVTVRGAMKGKVFLWVRPNYKAPRPGIFTNTDSVLLKVY